MTQKRLFGTDGIRGVAGAYPLDEAGSIQVGKSIGKHFAKVGDMIVIGFDPRESSEDIVKSVAKGLNEVGVDVQIIGIVPTPCLAFITKNTNAVAGVMVTASHNPYTDNGIKVFTQNGGKLSDTTEDSLNKLIYSEISTTSVIGNTTINSELRDIYEKYLVQTVDDTEFNNFTIALDSANGATSGIASRIFKQVGAKVTTLFDKPDGTNINVDCGATNTNALREFVIKNNIDAGVAFDGDGDRLIMVDKKGRELDGDVLLYILAVAGNHKGVVATIMSNKGLETSLSKKDVALHRTNVGDRYVLEGLEKTGYDLGGEKSGHIILSSLATTGDGMLAALQVLKLVHSSSRLLDEWFDELELLPQALVNIPLEDKSKLVREDVAAYIEKESQALGANGRINIRSSGTEPKARIMVESSDALDRANKIAKKLKILLESEK